MNTRSSVACNQLQRHPHRGARQKLRHPGSAIFDGQTSWTDPETPLIISRTSDGGVRAVGGRVNAKNGFGGYTGERLYIVDFEGDFVTASATVEEMQSHCLTQ
jgi:hypothetical protein